MTRRQFGGLTLASSALLLAACQNKPAAQAATSLNMAVPMLDAVVDPHLTGSLQTLAYAQNFWSTLVRFKFPDDGQTLASPGEADGELATSWKLDSTGMTVQLRDAKSAAGNPLTAADVKWSFERNIGIQQLVPNVLRKAGGIDDKTPITVIDDHTVHINGTLTPIVLGVLCTHPFSIIDSVEAKKHATADDPWAKAWMANNSASFAAYTVQSFTSTQDLRLTANPNYWRGGGQFKQVGLHSVPDSSSRLQLLLSGQVDWAEGLSASDFDAAKKSDKVQSVVAASSSSNLLYTWPDKQPAMRDQRVRAALSMAIDRAGLISGGPYKNLAKAAGTSVCGFMVHKEPITPFPLDVNQAKSLLAEAGFGNGLTLSLGASPQSLFGSGFDYQSVCVQLAAQFKAIGVTLNLILESSGAAVTEGTKNLKYDLTLSALSSFVPDAAYQMSSIYPTKAPLNHNFSFPEVDQSIQQALAAPVGSARNDLVAQADAVLRQQMPTIPIVDVNYTTNFRSGIKGFKPRGGQLFFNEYSDSSAGS